MNKLKRAGGLLLCVALVSVSLSCGKNYAEKMTDAEKLFYGEKYLEAARLLLPYVNKEDKDQLLFMMECGLMLHTGGEFEKSNQVLLPAGKLADTMATSVSQQAGSILLNETVTNYKGEDFEVVLLHVFTGLNFLHLKDFDSARVEFKKVNDVLRAIAETGGAAYKQNIMAKYLTAMTFEIMARLNNDLDDLEFAYVEYKQILNLAPTLAPMVAWDLQRTAKKLGYMDDYGMWVGRFGPRPDVTDEHGQLFLIYQCGQGAVKASRGSLLDDKAMQFHINVAINSMQSMQQGVTAAGIIIALKVAENPIPRFDKRSNQVAYMMLNVDGNDIGRTTMLEDIETTAVMNMEEKYGRIIAKTAAGIVVKAAASVAAGIAAKKLAEQSKQLGGVAGLIGAAAGAGVGVGLASQIKPDLRCWHTLPANLQFSRYFFEPGTYDISFKFVGRNGQVVTTRDYKKVEISKGQTTMVNYRTLF
jgi:hypothetical protein